jgi:hypothetical protein
MRAVDTWFQSAKAIYERGSTDALLDRALRARGEVDLVIFAFLILEELRLLREGVEQRLGDGSRS